MREILHKLLNDLKLGGMSKCLDEALDRAVAEQLPVEEVLERLLCNESAYRQEKALSYRLKQAKLRWPWAWNRSPLTNSPVSKPRRFARWPPWTLSKEPKTSSSSDHPVRAKRVWPSA